MSTSEVQVTADALVVIRSDMSLTRQTGIIDPHAKLFVTPAGVEMSQMARSLDPIYVEFNLARYRHFSEQLSKWLPAFQQFILLGAGFDTRPLFMEHFLQGKITVYEVDFIEKLAAKKSILEQEGFKYPPWIRQIQSDIAKDPVGQLLTKEGYDSRIPTLVLMEGLLYFLPSDVTIKILDPRTLELSLGSRVLFDFWLNSRIEKLNSSIEDRGAKKLFFPFPWDLQIGDLRRSFIESGYSEVTLLPLDRIAAKTYGHSFPREHDNLWWIASLQV